MSQVYDYTFAETVAGAHQSVAPFHQSIPPSIETKPPENQARRGFHGSRGVTTNR